MGDSGSSIKSCACGPWRRGRSSEDGSTVQSNCTAIKCSEHACSRLQSRANVGNFSYELARDVGGDVSA